MRQLRDNAEEARQTALAERQKALEEAKQIQRDTEKVKSALELTMREGRMACQKIETDIEEREVELQALKTRITTFLAEDRKSRQSATDAAKEANQHLDALLGQIDVAKREKEKLDSETKRTSERLNSLQMEIEREQRRFEKEKEFRMQVEEMSLNELRKNAEDEQKALLRETSQRLEDMAASVLQRCQQVEYVLDERAKRVETLQGQLSIAIQKYKQDVASLRINERECESLMEELNEQVAKFASSEGREKRLKEELQNEVERLSAQVEEQRQEIITTRSDFQEREARYLAHSELLEGQLKAIQTERDSLLIKVKDLSTDIERERSQHSKERANLEDNLKQMNERMLAESRKAEHALAQLQHERVADAQEQSQLNTLMARLETNSIALERKLEEIEKERLELQEVNADYESRFKLLEKRVSLWIN